MLLDRLVLNQNPENCPDKRYVDYMCPELVVDEIFEAFIDDKLINIYISEIEEEEGDYLIRGFDENDKKLEFKFRKVQFWIS